MDRTDGQNNMFDEVGITEWMDPTKFGLIGMMEPMYTTEVWNKQI